MSEWLDGHRELLDLVTGDLCQRRVKAAGRHGLPAESALRCALLKQHRQLSYEELAFHLEDFGVVSGFCGAANGMDSEKVCAAKNLRRHPGRYVGGDQPDAARRRPAAKGRRRQRCAARQHCHRSAHARTKRQQPALHATGIKCFSSIFASFCAVYRRPLSMWRRSSRYSVLRPHLGICGPKQVTQALIPVHGGAAAQGRNLQTDRRPRQTATAFPAEPRVLPKMLEINTSTLGSFVAK